MRINLQNFLTFKEQTSFDLLPITLLTGRADSRKESFFKIMQYLKNGWRKLDIGDEEIDIFSEKDAEDYKLSNSDIRVQCTSNHPLLPFDFMEEAVYGKNGMLKKRRIFLEKNGSEFFNERIEMLEIPALDRNMTEKTLKSAASAFTMDYKFLADLIYDLELRMEYLHHVQEGHLSGFNYSRKALKEFTSVVRKGEIFSPSEALPGYSEKLNLSNYKEKFKALKIDDYLVKDLVRNSVFINEVKGMKRDYLLYEVYFDGKNVADLPEVSAGIMEIQDRIFNHFSMQRFGLSFEDKEFFLDMVRNLAEGIETFVKDRFKDYFDEVKSVEVKLSALGRLMLTEKLFRSRNYKEAESFPYNCSLLEKIVSESFSSLESFSDIEFITLDRSIKEEVLTTSTSGGMYEDAMEFRSCLTWIEKCKGSESNHRDKDNAELLTKSLQLLGLDGEIHVELPVPGAAVIYVELNGEKLPLTALGNSYSRIVPLLMKLFILRVNKAHSSAYIYIEEPEAGLDPETQFLLAEIFRMWGGRTSNWFFILQSNSPALKEGFRELIRDGKLDSEHVAVNHVTFNPEKCSSLVQTLKLSDSGGVGRFPTEEGEDITGILTDLSDAQLN